MEIITIEKEKMVAMQALAKVNVTLTEAEGKLLMMKAKTEEYISAREKLTEERIQNLLSESTAVLNEIQGNYKEIEQFYNTTVNFSEGLDSSFARLQKLHDEFMEWKERVEKLIDEKEEELRILERDTRILASKVASDAESNKRRTDELNQWQTRLLSKEESLKSALQVIKDREKQYGN